MKRNLCTPRQEWPRLVKEDGLLWHSANDQTYWNEGVYYSFTPKDIETLEIATREVYELLLRVGDVVSKSKYWMDQFGIPVSVQPMILESWEKEPPALNYGRFDWGFDEEGIPKLFEFNCDTPTSLLEASVIQWKWKEHVFPNNDQFNSIHEKLVEKWKDLRTHLLPTHPIHFTGSMMEESGEDVITLAYLRDTAEQAGFKTASVAIDDIGINKNGEFLDMDDVLIRQVFKLYPWEMMVTEEYLPHLQTSVTTWIEPIWKMMWSNKAVLAALYALEPDCPWLLPTLIGGPGNNKNYVRKPILSREGSNVEVVRDGKIIASSGGEYGREGYVYQDLFNIPDFSGNYPVLGTWIIDGEPAGMGIREDGLITGNTARFVPHIIEV